MASTLLGVKRCADECCESQAVRRKFEQHADSSISTSENETSDVETSEIKTHKASSALFFESSERYLKDIAEIIFNKKSKSVQEINGDNIIVNTSGQLRFIKSKKYKLQRNEFAIRSLNENSFFTTRYIYNYLKINKMIDNLKNERSDESFNSMPIRGTELYNIVIKYDETIKIADRYLIDIANVYSHTNKYPKEIKKGDYLILDRTGKLILCNSKMHMLTQDEYMITSLNEELISSCDIYKYLISNEIIVKMKENKINDTELYDIEINPDFKNISTKKSLLKDIAKIYDSEQDDCKQVLNEGTCIIICKNTQIITFVDDTSFNFSYYKSHRLFSSFVVKSQNENLISTRDIYEYLNNDKIIKNIMGTYILYKMFYKKDGTKDLKHLKNSEVCNLIIDVDSLNN